MKKNTQNYLRNAISFISEHTIEYLIVIKIMNILSEKFMNIVPVYFWSTREGNTLSKRIHSEYTIQLLAVFPRRPKININDTENIYGKINSALFDYTVTANNLNIPVVLGFPVVSSIIELNTSADFKWISIPPNRPKDIYFKIYQKKYFIIIGKNKNYIIKVLTEKGICDLIIKNNTEFSWDTAIDNIRTLNRKITKNRLLFFASYYKPIYFFIFNKK